LFQKVLIANRGEIACRVLRSLHRLGIAGVAVYSDADAAAQHVKQADEAVRIGPPAAADSYLRIDAVIEAALARGAEAIHPGYGFLSENAAFADACAAAGLVFVGPPADAIRAMGSKSEAKAIMAEAGVPLVPGYHGAEQDPARLAEAAAEIGFPVLIKASAGGGGKGMRAVERAEDFAAALASAQREAKSAFGDARVLIERYLKKPRHVEVQVFADGHGQAVHLFERDCSLQRRHQKVLEEAPAPGLDEALREELGAASVRAAQAIGYRGAGTVEFIMEDGAFYFMEMNTRLQVEHPVTELITGTDLVEWQLRVAAGEPLPMSQAALQEGRSGHAVEVRLYAEDPDRDFLPTTGRLDVLAFGDGGIRVDSGVAEGDSILPFYDPMIAKLIAWGPDRKTAFQRLALGLERSTLAGCTTNLAFLRRLLRHPDVMAGQVDTGLIGREMAALGQAEAASAETAACAAFALLQQETAGREETRDPWSARDGWRLNLPAFRSFTLIEEPARHAVTLVQTGEGWSASLPEGPLPLRAVARQGPWLTLQAGSQSRRLAVAALGQNLWVDDGAAIRSFTLLTAEAEAAEEGGGDGLLVAPMPGKIVALSVEAGATVTAGQALLVLEAMKMEHAIVAPADGLVEGIRFGLGDLVEDGAILVDFKAAEETAA